MHYTSIMNKIAWAIIWAGAAWLSTLLPDASWQTGVILAVVSFPALVYFLGQWITLRQGIMLVALLGLACAGYLSYGWSGGITECATGGCSKAQSSSYATLFFSLPTSMVGVFGYSLILLVNLLPRFPAAIGTALLATFGFAVSLYLTLSSIFVLETTCQWCLGSAMAMTTLLLLTYRRLWITLLLENNIGNDRQEHDVV